MRIRNAYKQNDMEKIKSILQKKTWIKSKNGFEYTFNVVCSEELTAKERMQLSKELSEKIKQLKNK